MPGEKNEGATRVAGQGAGGPCGRRAGQVRHSEARGREWRRGAANPRARTESLGGAVRVQDSRSRAEHQSHHHAPGLRGEQVGISQPPKSAPHNKGGQQFGPNPDRLPQARVKRIT